MGRRPRSTQHERCKTPDPKKSGKAAAWLVVFLVTFWQATAPTLCRDVPPVVADAGTDGPQLPPVTFSDAAVGDSALLVAGPEPVPGQKPGPCETGMTEMRGVCWYELKDRPPKCPSGSVAWGGRCWVPVNGALKKPPVAEYP